jgi:hypothetical protein
MSATDSPFTPEDVPAELAGLDAALVADLYDLVAKYGEDVRGVDGLRRLTLPGPRPIHASVTVHPSPYRHVLLSTMAGAIMAGTAHAMLLKDGKPSALMWDKAFSLADVRAAIAAADTEHADCRDPVTGVRRRVVSDGWAKAKLSVDAVFGTKGKVILPSGDGMDAETLLAQFDRPDDLAVIDAGEGRRGLCRKVDLSRIARREAATAAVLARRGIRSQAQIDRMSHSALRGMLAEIEAELDRQDN